MDVFRIVIIAIAAIALLWVLLALLPQFLPKEDAFALLENNLSGAKITLGKPILQDISFAQNVSFSGKSFDERNTSVAFECNDAQVCCSEGDRCGRIEWDSRHILFNSQRTIKTAARCSVKNDLFECKIFFGKAPAQIIFKKATIKPEIDLSKEPAVLNIEVQNSGSMEMLSGNLEITVFQKYFENGLWKKSSVEYSSKILPLKSLPAGETASVQVPLEFTDGTFEINAVVSGENSGFDKNVLAVTVSGSEKCLADYCEAPQIDVSTGECKTACRCTGCMFGSSCEEKTKFANAGEFDSLSANILGSNIIEFVLGSEKCS
ncbi:MAG TPA: hypothetical protein VI977_03375 [archaeon]|nr:hypothetical protein [archaeon]